MKNFLIVALLFSSSITATEFVVKDIRFEGLQRVSLDTALLSMMVQSGDNIDDNNVAGIIKSLYSTSNFENIRVFKDGEDILVKVIECPIITRISFSGNKIIADEKLNKHLTASGLHAGTYLDRAALSHIEKKLKNFYYSVGKYNAQVSTIITPLPRNRADVKFVFTESVSTKVQQINFIGNDVFSDEELQSNFKLRADVPWWNFLADDKYQEQILARDIENLKLFYLNHGYLKFHVASTHISLSPDKKGVYITLTIDEGLPFNVSNINFRGGKKGDDYSSLVTIKAGETYKGEKVTALEDAIKRQLSEQGYAYTQVATIPEFNEDNQTVALNVNIELGNRVYVRKIKFSGNQNTRDEVLRREMRQMEGSWLNTKFIEASKKHISRLGYFETVDVRMTPVTEFNDQVDIDYTVKEAHSGAADFGVGYGSSSGLSFQTSFKQENFAGTGNRLGIHATRNRYQKNLTLEYRNPYWTLDGISLGGKVFHNEFEASHANIVDYTDKSYGTNLTWGFPFDDLNYFDFMLGYTHRLIGNLGGSYQMKKFLDSQENNITENGSLKVNAFDWSVSWSRNNLNLGLFPTNGNYQRASFHMTVPGSNVQFFKTQYEARQYMPLTKSHSFTLLMRGSLGYGNGYGNNGKNDYLMPFYENFYIGGFSTLRGFRSNSAGPKAVYDQGAGNNPALVGSHNSVGGNATALTSVELIFPTPLIPAQVRNSIRTSVFVDVASVWDTEYDLKNAKIIDGQEYIYDYSNPTNYRASYGVALEWHSPVGPLIFSLSKPIKRYKGDRKEFFNFTIGQVF
ncbi:Outer membrane protein assembly factor YaeT precursor [Candidatus Enterovibrio altilux]|uniref:Outer membrane protein assembly factor BamA n=2 Tax=Candidatus Enterovibrio altilux TaxID=1927128 RepID=A0A291BAF1_9GAMM|nr:Outer membrane protein assembly factor YaeT precursor [Candidatus Enterovibrio luxaltus]